MDSKWIIIIGKLVGYVPYGYQLFFQKLLTITSMDTLVYMMTHWFGFVFWRPSVFVGKTTYKDTFKWRPILAVFSGGFSQESIVLASKLWRREGDVGWKDWRLVFGVAETNPVAEEVVVDSLWISFLGVFWNWRGEPSAICDVTTTGLKKVPTSRSAEV